jgi:hypothetical protein
MYEVLSLLTLCAYSQDATSAARCASNDKFARNLELFSGMGIGGYRLEKTTHCLSYLCTCSLRVRKIIKASLKIAGR